MKLIEILKSSLIIFYALLAGQTFFLLISLYLVNSGIIQADSEHSLIFKFVIFFILGPSRVVGLVIYRKIILRQSADDKTMEQKMILYRQGMIIKLAMIEGASIFSTVCFLITGDYLFVIISIFLISLFFLHKPTIEKFASDFNIPLSQIDLKQSNS